MNIKRLKDMTWTELQEEARPIFEREEREHRQRIKEFLQTLGVTPKEGQP